MDKHIKLKPDQYTPFVFVEIQIDQKEDNTVTLDQTAYIRNMVKLQMDCIFESFRFIRNILALVGATRPDMVAAGNLLIQVTIKTFTPKRIEEINNVIQHLHDTVDQ